MCCPVEQEPTMASPHGSTIDFHRRLIHVRRYASPFITRLFYSPSPLAMENDADWW